MNIIVTGGAGFIGQNSCDRLLEDGHSVMCVDNMSTGSLDALHNLSNKFLPTRFCWVAYDVEESSTELLSHIEEFFHGTVDQIFHLACPASPAYYQLDPVKTLMTSVLGTRNILDIGRLTGATVLFTSTSEIYGDPEPIIQKEDYRGSVNCTGPRACYDEGKRAAESLCFDYIRKYNARVKVVRIFNTYGPKMSPTDGRVVSNFITQALRGEDITIYGYGEQTRSFCYVTDMVEGLIRMMNSDPNFIGPVNLGNINEITVQELCNIVLSLTKSHSNVAYVPLPIDDPRKRKPDIMLAKEELDWEPSVDLQSGLRKTIKFFKKNLGIEVVDGLE